MEGKPMPSSATAGFFQPRPDLRNQYDDDSILRHVVKFYIPDAADIHNELQTFAQEVIKPDIFDLIADAERHPPTISTHSTFGRPSSRLHTSHGWRALQSFGIENGVVSRAYQEPSPSRLVQFLKYHIWSGSAAVVTCPSAMTDGAATLLRRQLDRSSLSSQERSVFTEAYRRLISSNPSFAWTSGQWMTERSGGSDVSGTETLAEHAGMSTQQDAHGMPLGPYVIHGFKWFSSATDSQMTVLLAKLDGKLSAFFAPMRRRASDGSIEMNGVSIQRLKPKLGTRALPTAELVVEGMRAWLIGKPGDGVREIAAILNITRIHNALSALGFWGRALGIARAFARVRQAQGRLLQDVPAHVAGLAANTVAYAGHMQLGFFVVRLFDIVDRPTDLVTGFIVDADQARHLLRLLTPVAKAQCSKQAIYGIQECMESLGGVGYIEDEQDINIARLFRDANVLSIWEGTTNIMADDVVRVIKGREGQESCNALTMWARTRMSNWSGAEGVRARFENVIQEFEDLTSWEANAIRVNGRHVLELLAWLVGGIMLQEVARYSEDPAMSAIATAWLSTRSSTRLTDHTSDRVIALAAQQPSDPKSRL